MENTTKGVMVLLSNELNEAVKARILEKNMTIQQYMVDLIEQDLAVADNEKPEIATMHDENDKLCDDVLNTDKTDEETWTEDKQRLLDMLWEVACMKDSEEEE